MPSKTGEYTKKPAFNSVNTYIHKHTHANKMLYLQVEGKYTLKIHQILKQSWVVGMAVIVKFIFQIVLPYVFPNFYDDHELFL